MSITIEQARQLHDGKVYAADGGKVGAIGQVYLDDTTGEPAWVTAKTGLFGTSESFVPLQDARANGNDVTVAYDEATIKKAPRVDPDGHLEPDEEDELYRYYQLSDHDRASADEVESSDAGNVAAGRTSPTDGQDVPSDLDDPSEVGDHRPDISDRTVGYDRSGPTTDQAMTRSEEQLNVSTQKRRTGRARLRKYVSTETVTQTVPVRREEVTLHREPITDANRAAATSGPAISEEEHEVVPHDEVPVVDKDVVAVERVKLDTDTVTEQATVSDDVRKEQIELDEPATDNPPRQNR